MNSSAMLSVTIAAINSATSDMIRNLGRIEFRL